MNHSVTKDDPEGSHLDAVMHMQLPGLVAGAVALEHARYGLHRVDGGIIGTGAADFTTGNVCYTLHHHDGTAFQLFDVPGIEGDESKYTGMVRAAVAKAHLVVYVNGTNKKPEKATAEKIRAYLNRGTQVSPVINVRGSADAYEFDEDRVALGEHGNCDAALKQTVNVLRGVLGDEVLIPGHCVQGLLGFTSLAMRGRDSTIHPSRGADLFVQQRNYLRHFATPEAMYAFSQMEQIAGVLRAKQGSFKQDIVESNKAKIRELLAENIAVLEKMRYDHADFLSKIAPEFDKCHAGIESALASFDRLLVTGRTNIWNDFFNDVIKLADDIVAENFGENERISKKIGTAFTTEQVKVEAALKTHLDEQILHLQEGLAQATQRLVEDVRRVNFQERMRNVQAGSPMQYQHQSIDMDLGLGDWGAIALNIGSYAMSGMAIGSVVPGLGNVVGAVIGAAVGALISLRGFFTGKDKRIRQAQAQVQEKIEEARERAIAGLKPALKELTKPISSEVDASVTGWVRAMHASLQQPLEVIEAQIGMMKITKNQLEKMSHGTVQPIQY
jgi:hypothetical protein